MINMVVGSHWYFVIHCQATKPVLLVVCEGVAQVIKQLELPPCLSFLFRKWPLAILEDRSVALTLMHVA